MKQQRNQIRAAAAVEANLGDVEAGQSRFIDAGFVSTGGRDVDWAGKFLNAAKSGISAYHATDDYQQQVREQKTQGLASATNHIKDVEYRAEQAENEDGSIGIKAKDMPFYLMKEMESAVSLLGSDDEADDSLSRTYKETFLASITGKYQSMAATATARANVEHRAEKEQQQFKNIKDGNTGFEEVKENLKTLFADSQISAIWAKGKSGHLADVASKFEKTYDSYTTMYSEEVRDISDEMKAKHLTRKEWLLERSEDGKTLPTMADVIESRILKKGVTNPITDFDALLKEALEQEGSDGVGAIAELNTTEGVALLKSARTSLAKIKGVKFKKDILTSIALGQGDVTSMLNSAKTGVESEDTTLSNNITAGLIQQTATWWTNSITDPDPGVRQENARLLADFLIKNPDYQAKTITPIANGFAAKWKGALDAQHPGEAIAMLAEMSDTLWSTDTGSATRDVLLKASGAGFELAMKAYRVGILPEHIVEMSKGNLPEVTQEAYKVKFGADSYAESKNSYMAAARESMPWAGPQEVADITKFAMDFDFHEIGFDKTSFFEAYGEGMSHRASSPKAEMQAGEQHQITDFFGGRIFTPKSGAWKKINAVDASNSGYTQGLLHHLFANSSTALTDEIVTGLGMELVPKRYGSKGRKGDYFTLNYGEGVTDDFQPIRIRRHGKNEWKLELTTKEWTDNKWVVGDRQPYVGIILSNDDLNQGMVRFDGHLKAIEDYKGAESTDFKGRVEKSEVAKTERLSKPIKSPYANTDVIGTLKEFFNLGDEVDKTATESVISPYDTKFIPILSK